MISYFAKIIHSPFPPEKIFQNFFCTWIALQRKFDVAEPKLHLLSALPTLLNNSKNKKRTTFSSNLRFFKMNTVKNYERKRLKIIK
jgi:hypothetical protein